MSKKKLISKIIMFVFLVIMLLPILELSESRAAGFLKGYTISSGFTTAYSDTNLKKKLGTIYPTDELKVLQYQKNYAKVTYPTAKGSKTGYISTSAIFVATGGEKKEATKRIITYRRNSSNNSYGYIERGDIVTVLGKKGSFTQIIYPVSGGNKVAWIRSSEESWKQEINSRTIADGVYRFESKSGKRMDVKGASQTEGANIQLWEANDTDAQIFRIEYVNGSYRITNVGSGKVLDVDGAKTHNGSNIAQYRWHGGNNQRWKIVNSGEAGYYEVLSTLNEQKALDISGGKFDNGTNIQLWDRNKSNAQKWKIVPYIENNRTIEDGIYCFESKSGKRMDVKGASRTEGANIQLWEANDTEAQLFRVEYVDESYRITNVGSGKVLDVDGAKTHNGSNIAQYVWHGGNNQKWKIFKSQESGYYEILSVLNTQKALDISGGKFDNGTNIQLWDRNQSDAQKWRIVAGKSNEELKRQSVVNYMNAMAQVVWTPSESFEHWSGSKNGPGFWKAGTTYYGIPYSQLSRETNLEVFRSYLNGKSYVGPSKKNTYKGNDCSSAVSMAWRTVNKKVPIKSTATMMPGNSYISKVGNYEISNKNTNTSTICYTNGTDKIYSAYRQLRKGDAVLCRSSNEKHVMLVTGISENEITVTHQTTYNGNLKSTWRINETWTFNKLYTKGYIPISMTGW